MTKCPECESDLELDGYELDVGETINCPECSIELKVIGNDPDQREPCADDAATSDEASRLAEAARARSFSSS